MVNKVAKIVFPLSGGCHLQEYNYFDGGIVSIPYIAVPLYKLHKAVKVSREQSTKIMVTDNVFVYGTRGSGGNTFIIASMEYGDPKDPEVFTPELYDTLTYEWLLEQIAVIEEGVEYTGHCLLHDTELIVFNTEDPYNNTVPITLLKVLTKALKELVKSKEGFTKLSSLSVWNYFTRFITIEESASRVILSNNAKRLIADMKLRGIQNTTTYYLLQRISGIVDTLQQEQIRKLP